MREVIADAQRSLAKDNAGYSTLMWAAMNGHENCVMLLLPHSDPLDRSHYEDFGDSALMLAACYGHAACVKLLLPRSKPLALNNKGKTASQIARQGGHQAVADMIDAYILSQTEEHLLTAHVPPAPPRQAHLTRM